MWDTFFYARTCGFLRLGFFCPHCQGIVVQPVVEQHHTLRVPLALPPTIMTVLGPCTTLLTTVLVPHRVPPTLEFECDVKCALAPLSPIPLWGRHDIFWHAECTTEALLCGFLVLWFCGFFLFFGFVVFRFRAYSIVFFWFCSSFGDVVSKSHVFPFLVARNYSWFHGFFGGCRICLFCYTSHAPHPTCQPCIPTWPYTSHLVVCTSKAAISLW